VKVRCDEGVAIHIDPKPCAGIREDVGEASAGERAGQPLSRVSDFIRGADAVSVVEGNTDGHAIASVGPTPRGLRPIVVVAEAFSARAHFLKSGGKLYEIPPQPRYSRFAELRDSNGLQFQSHLRRRRV
jgi:hypothetical protein